MFASTTLTAHLLRGAIGIGAIGIALAMSPSYPWVPIVALPIALIALRGCPMCWTLGLIETITARVRGRPSRGACIDGSCAVGERHAPADHGGPGRDR